MWSRLNHARYVRTRHNNLVDDGCIVEDLPYLLLALEASNAHPAFDPNQRPASVVEQ